MNRLVAAACTSLVLVAACDDDDDLFKADATVLGDAPATETGAETGPAACTGTFAGLNRTQLQMATSASGACAASGDLDLICTGGIAEKVRMYGSACLQAGHTAPAALQTCVTNMVNANHTFTAGCLNCYIGSVSCSLQKCQASCTANPSGAECRTCQQEQGCLSAFFACSGITPPGTPTDAGSDASDGPRDGGDAGDAGGTDGGADGGADGPADGPAADTSADVAAG